LLAAATLGHPVETMVKVKKTETRVTDIDENGKEITRVTKSFVYEPKIEWSGKDSLLGYLRWMGKTHPKEFLQGLLRIMPLQIQAGDKEDEPEFYQNKEEVLERLRARGLPTKVAEAITAQAYEALDRLQGKPKAGA
jgi:hypothetical protein